MDGFIIADEPVETGVSFTTENPVIHSPEDTEILTRKYSTALSGSPFTTDELRNKIANGGADEFRNWLSSKKNMASESIRESTMAGFVETATPTPENVDLARSIATVDLRSNPATVLESEHVSKVLDSIRLSSENPINPANDALYDKAKESLTKKELFARLQAEMQPVYEESLLSLDFAETLVPFLSWSRFRSEIQSNGLVSQFWKGDNVEELISKFYSLPAEEGYKQAKETIERLASSNKFDAAALAAALVNYGNSDRFWDNVETGFDIASLATSKTLLRGVSKAIGNRAYSPSKIMDASGNVEAAAKLRVVEEAVSSKLNELGSVTSKVPSVFDPSRIAQSAGTSFSNGFANRLEQRLQQTSAELLNKVIGTLPVKRLDEGSQALETALDEASTYLRTTYSPRFADAILDIRPLSSETRLGNVDGVELALGKAKSTKPVLAGVRKASDPLNKEAVPLALKADNVDVAVGQSNGLLFATQEQALNHAKNIYQFIDGQYTIKQHGAGHYISIIKNVDETSPGVFRAQAIETNHRPERGILGFIRSKAGLVEDLMSDTMSQARKTAVYGGADTLEALAQAYKNNITTFLPRREMRENFSRFVNVQRDVVRNGEVGRFSRTLGEFEEDWIRINGRAPTEAEAHAYFSYVQLSDMDWVLRNMDVYTKQAQAGWSMFAFDTRGTKLKKPVFEGKRVDVVEYAPDNHTGVVVWSENGIEGIRHNGRGSGLTRADISDLVANGYSVIKMHSSAADKLRAYPGAARYLPEGDIHYVLTRNYKEGPLDFNRVAYRPGGHKEYIDDWFISSPIVRASGDPANPAFFYNTYLRDFNIGSSRTKEQGQYFEAIFNQARGLYNAGDRLGLQRFIMQRFPAGFDIQRFERMANEIDMTRPFRLRRNGTSLDEAYPLAQEYPAYRKAGSNPLRADEAGETTAYTTQRQNDLPLFDFDNSNTHPIVRLGSANLLDATEVLARSFNNIVKGRYLEDLKVKQSREFIGRYRNLIEIPDTAEARLNPYKYALDAPFKKGVTDTQLMAEAQTYRKAMLNFLGIENSEQIAVRTFRDRVLNGVMRTLGDGRAYQYLDAKLAHRVTDPTSFLRGTAFHTHMGMFNPMSYLTQLSQFTTIAAINPLEAPRAMAWSHYMNLMKIAHPKVQETLLKKAAAWGGNSSHFQEAYQGYLRAGARTVGNTVSYLDDFSDAQLTKGAGTKFLDAGRVFFDSGERTTRRIAYNSAYLEWREANPTRKFGDSAQAWVLDRMDTLTGHMTKASYSTWQKGIVQVPTQFMNFHIRLADDIMGGKLTPAESARIMTMNSILYGIPVGTLGTTAGLAAWGEYGRQYADKKGIDFDSNLFVKGFLEGGLSVMSKQLTGDSFNFGDRFGPAGKSPIVDILSGESFLEILGGAGSKTVVDMVKAASPLAYMTLGAVNGNDELYDLSLTDFKNAITSNISSMSHAQKTYTILKTGEFVSKKGIVIGEVDNWKGYVFGALGIAPDSITRGLDKQAIVKGIKESKEKYEREALNSFERAYSRMAKDNDIEAFHAEMKKARVFLELGGFTPQEKFRIQGRAAKSNETMVERAERNFRETTPERLQQYYDKLGKKQ